MPVVDVTVTALNSAVHSTAFRLIVRRYRRPAYWKTYEGLAEGLTAHPTNTWGRDRAWWKRRQVNVTTHMYVFKGQRKTESITR